jgi:uncharacterized protein
MLTCMNAYCSRCVGTQLRPRIREGIEVDVCPSCRGVWLDRGELEKLLSLAAGHRESDQYEGPPSSSRPGSNHAGQRRKRGLLATLGDLFD